MLFNSYEFIFLFLPIIWCGFFLAARYRHEAAATWLALASLVFYGYWDIHYVPLLLISITVNYHIGKQISDCVEQKLARQAKSWLIAGLVFDLGLLGYYKYTGFLLNSWVDLTGSSATIPQIILPLGISFFTFTQIAYLADCHKGIVKERNPVHYLLFITYFPHLIAGPILHHRQMMPQFAKPEIYRINQENIAVGLTIFAIGMFKKVMLADSLAHYPPGVFAVGQHAGTLYPHEAWLGAIAYSLQLYFDFSGYSDMAIGLSRLFGIKMPLNFNSPYKSRSMIEFWRRWHITLSRFLSEYLYITLGGNRLGEPRRFLNMMITMLLGGLWHGAGWTYVIWGGLHGSYLLANHLFRKIFPQSDTLSNTLIAQIWSHASWALTLLCIIVSMVVFRSSSIHDAVVILKAMAGISPGSGLELIEVIEHADDGWEWVIGTALIALFAPNTQEIMAKFSPAFEETSSTTRLQWRPHPGFALLAGLLLGLSIVNIGQVSEFLYFQF